MKTRYFELDSIRGLAALSVLFSHLIISLPHLSLRNLLEYSPLHIFWAGSEAVILFFILSGFVLYLPLSNSKFNYFSFLIKRIFRIYLPYLLIIVIAMFLSCLFTRVSLINCSDWLNNLNRIPFNGGQIIPHILFIGNYNTNVFNPVIWSLVIEMRVSIVFPLITLSASKFNWKLNIIICFVLQIIPLITTHLGIGMNSNYLSTFSYLPMFIFGALLAKNRVLIINFFSSLSLIYKTLIGFIAPLIYTYRWWGPYPSIHLHLLDNWIISLGACFFIVLSMSSKKLSKLLRCKPIFFTGKISYSFYLLHFLILMSFMRLFLNIEPIWLIWLEIISFTFILSTISYYFVELPAIKLGKRVSEFVEFIFFRKSDELKSSINFYKS